MAADQAQQSTANVEGVTGAQSRPVFKQQEEDNGGLSGLLAPMDENQILSYIFEDDVPQAYQKQPATEPKPKTPSSPPKSREQSPKKVPIVQQPSPAKVPVIEPQVAESPKKQQPGAVPPEPATAIPEVQQQPSTKMAIATANDDSSKYSSSSEEAANDKKKAEEREKLKQKLALLKEKLKKAKSLAEKQKMLERERDREIQQKKKIEAKQAQKAKETQKRQDPDAESTQRKQKKPSTPIQKIVKPKRPDVSPGKQQDKPKNPAQKTQQTGLDANVPDDAIDYNNKVHLVDEFAKRWWYALPAWPPADFDYAKALESQGLELVEPKQLKEPSTKKRVVSVEGYQGVYKDAEGRLHDVRPADSCPSLQNFQRMTVADLQTLLSTAYSAQAKQISDMLSGKLQGYDRATEIEIEQSLKLKLSRIGRILSK